jgi:hypothetical protein
MMVVTTPALARPSASSDLVPTTAHLKPTWVAAFDLYPLQTIDTKTRWLARAEAENWICGFGHDCGTCFSLFD